MVAFCMAFTFLASFLAFHSFADAATPLAVASTLELSRALLVVAFALEVFPLLLWSLILGLSSLVAAVSTVAQAAAYVTRAGTAAL